MAEEKIFIVSVALGRTFPTFGIATEPGAVFDIGPKFIQTSAQAVGLDAQLIV